jgi:hypothetical protein
VIPFAWAIPTLNTLSFDHDASLALVPKDVRTVHLEPSFQVHEPIAPVIGRCIVDQVQAAAYAAQHQPNTEKAALFFISGPEDSVVQ